ncbi:MAG: twin-arginine translocation signal domain-containing protein [Desulfomonilaceae bacterium]
MTNNPSRRDFLKSGLAASAILMVWKSDRLCPGSGRSACCSEFSITAG